MKRICLLLLSILFFSCTTPVEKLSPDAAKVTVLSNPNLGDLEKLKRVGTGSCEMGANVRTQNSNQTSCENYLRNEAAKQSAEYIVFTHTKKTGLSTAMVEASFYKRK